MGSEDDRQHMRFGVALASAVSQIGCVTVVIILGAVAAGLAVIRRMVITPVSRIFINGLCF